MTTDDAPRPALDAGEIEQGWAYLAWSRSETSSKAMLILWLFEHADALLAAAAERDALAREAARLRRAVVLALDGPSDGDVGMETTLGRLHRIERQLRAALAPAAGETEGAGDAQQH